MLFGIADAVITICASIGGIEAIHQLLADMPPDASGMVIAQHIPEAFSASFAERMNFASEMNVYEASDGQQIVAWDVCIVPGN